MHEQPGVGRTAEVSVAVSGWLQDVGRLLQSVQVVVENATPTHDAPAAVGAMLLELPPLIRQCRAQVPTAEMVEAWVRSVSLPHNGHNGARDVPDLRPPNSSLRGQARQQAA